MSEKILILAYPGTGKTYTLKALAESFSDMTNADLENLIQQMYFQCLRYLEK